MSKYLTTKKDSLEDMVAKVSEGKQSEDYKQLFKKELEKTGKGVGSMSDIEKKAFFNNIDKKQFPSINLIKGLPISDSLFETAMIVFFILQVHINKQGFDLCLYTIIATIHCF